MSASLVAADSSRLRTTEQLPNSYPYSVGFWACPLIVNSAYASYWGMSSTASGTQYVIIQISNTNKWQITSQSGSSTGTCVSAATVVVGRWYYVLARYIASNNRKLSILDSTGTIEHVSSTANGPAFPTITNLTMGSYEAATPSQFPTGYIAEMWFTNTDIGRDGTQISDTLLRLLAYRGPYSVPEIGNNLWEYRSLRQSLASDTASFEEIEFGIKGRRLWQNINGVQIGPHPPLMVGYEPPIDIVMNRIV